MSEDRQTQKMQTTKPIDITQPTKTRFFVLFLLVMVVFGNQYAFNNPQALQESIKHKLEITQAEYDMLYTIFALPNIVSTVVLGYLIDYIGVRTGLITLMVSVTLFQSIIALGGAYESYATMLIGRMLFGIASESLVTAQACFVSFWFAGKELAFALGLAITLPELGNALNSYLSPIIYEKDHNLGAPLFVSVGICCVSSLCAIWAVYLDMKASKIKQLQDTLAHQNKQNAQSNVFSEKNKSQSHPIKFSDIKLLKPYFWLLVLLCMFYITCYVCFMDNAGQLLQKRFCYTEVSAGKATMLTYIVAASFSAPLGLLIDRVGKRRFFIMLGIGVFAIAHLIILAYPECSNPEEHVQNVNGATWGLLLIGLGYSFYANCLVPSIPLVIPKKVTGTAFGIMQMIESISLSLFPLFIGQMIEHANTQVLGYRYASGFYFGIGAVGFIASFGLLWVRKSVRSRLDAKSTFVEGMGQRKNEELSMSFDDYNPKERELRNLNLADTNPQILSQVEPTGVDTSKQLDNGKI